MNSHVVSPFHPLSRQSDSAREHAKSRESDQNEENGGGNGARENGCQTASGAAINKR